MNNMGGLPPPYPGYPPPPQQSGPPVAPPGLAPVAPGGQTPQQGGSAPPSPFHQPPTPQKMPADIEADKQKLRFQIEMEFVQCLGNPNYLNFLAQRGYFKEPTFVNYLKYLNYWSTHPYVTFLKYPVCLHFLELLQHESFRKEIVNAQCTKFLDDQTILHWQHYNRKRIKLVETAMNGGNPPTSTSSIAPNSSSNSGSNMGNNNNTPTTSLSNPTAPVAPSNAKA
eukprot:TRINITY_DN6822_c0_g1_i1.p1 TRINITY_DN6822_c0_g1~~TRINITY_DN6822_c0_g1_i1.p1  ORF type:complete len:241 (+),score=75.44 TRINITY_DN6822_c0_g1_i1:51-725(+)